VVTERQIESVVGRLDIAVIADRTWEGAAADIAARNRALEIDIGRHAPRREKVRRVIHKQCGGIRAIAPSDARPVNEPRRSLAAILWNAAGGRDVLVEEVDHRSA